MKIKSIFIAVLVAISFLAAAQTTPEPATKLLERAYKQASAEKKNVFVIFHASWCSWCRKLEASINDPLCKDFFSRSYVICELTILENGDNKKLENPGALEFCKENGGADAGLPYFLFLDSKGKLIADSRIKYSDKPDAKLSNMGCPAQEQEIAAFLDILKKSSKISDKEAAAIRERFSKNKS